MPCFALFIIVDGGCLMIQYQHIPLTQSVLSLHYLRSISSLFHLEHSLCLLSHQLPPNTTQLQQTALCHVTLVSCAPFVPSKLKYSLCGCYFTILCVSYITKDRCCLVNSCPLICHHIIYHTPPNSYNELCCVVDDVTWCLFFHHMYIQSV